MDEKLLKLSKLSRVDKLRAAEMLADAFSDDRLFTVYYFPNAGEHYHRYLLGLMVLSINHGLLFGEVYATSDKYEGLAIWYPPTYTGPSQWKDILSGAIPFMLRTGRKSVKRMERHLEYSLNLFNNHTNQECWTKGKCWLLWILAVAREQQKKGYASKLVKPMLQRIAEEGLPCYLETQNEANLPIYRHYGFEIAETGQLPGTDVPHWLMKLQPRSRKAE